PDIEAPVAVFPALLPRRQEVLVLPAVQHQRACPGHPVAIVASILVIHRRDVPAVGSAAPVTLHGRLIEAATCDNWYASPRPDPANRRRRGPRVPEPACQAELKSVPGFGSGSARARPAVA